MGGQALLGQTMNGQQAGEMGGYTGEHAHLAIHEEGGLAGWLAGGWRASSTCWLH